MAKKFLASPYEIYGFVDGDLGVTCEVRKDWYRQRYTVYTEDLLDAPLRLEFPLALPRDRFDSSIIPGGVSGVEDADTIQSLMNGLGVDTDEDYIFFVMTGRFFSAHDNEPMRFALIEPKRARDIMLMVSWQNGATSPTNNHIDQCICDSPVTQFAIFKDDNHGYSSATWVIPAGSPIGKRLVVEAAEKYAERIQRGVEHFRGYAQSCVKIRDNLWTRLYAESHEVADRRPTARLTLCDFYMYAEWHDADGEACDDYYFYTDIGVNNVLDLTRYWRDHDVVAGLVQMF